jgi:hypothetical protein
MTVGGVGNTGFLAFWVDVSLAADFVAETITNVSGGMSGVKIAEAGLTVPRLGHRISDGNSVSYGDFTVSIVYNVSTIYCR